MNTNKILQQVYESTNLSVREFADRIKMNQTNNLHDWLRNDKDISPTKLFKILDELGVKYEIKI